MLYPALHALVLARPTAPASRELVEHFFTAANKRFTVFSQSLKDTRDVFSDVIAPYYKSDVYTSTYMKCAWGCRGCRVLDSCHHPCPSGSWPPCRDGVLCVTAQRLSA